MFYESKRLPGGYRHECKECIKRLSRITYLANKERRAATVKAWQKKNRDKLNELSRKKHNANPRAAIEATRRWQIKNAEKHRAYRREYRHINPASVIRSELMRKRAVAQACVPWADRAKISAIYSEARRLTKETSTPWEVDHVIPLRHKLVCGLHVHTNLEIVKQTNNRQKSNKFVPSDCGQTFWLSPSEAVN
jgi:hypothetical protein